MIFSPWEWIEFHNSYVMFGNPIFKAAEIEKKSWGYVAKVFENSTENEKIWSKEFLQGETLKEVKGICETVARLNGWKASTNVNGRRMWGFGTGNGAMYTT